MYTKFLFVLPIISMCSWRISGRELLVSMLYTIISIRLQLSGLQSAADLVFQNLVQLFQIMLINCYRPLVSCYNENLTLFLQSVFFLVILPSRGKTEQIYSSYSDISLEARSWAKYFTCTKIHKEIISIQILQDFTLFMLSGIKSVIMCSTKPDKSIIF